MRNPRTFQPAGPDRLEGRVVLSQLALLAPRLRTAQFVRVVDNSAVAESAARRESSGTFVGLGAATVGGRIATVPYSGSGLAGPRTVIIASPAVASTTRARPANIIIAPSQVATTHHAAQASVVVASSQATARVK